MNVQAKGLTFLGASINLKAIIEGLMGKSAGCFIAP